MLLAHKKTIQIHIVEICKYFFERRKINMKYEKPEIIVYEAEEIAQLAAGAWDCGQGGSCTTGTNCGMALMDCGWKWGCQIIGACNYGV